MVARTGSGGHPKVRWTPRRAPWVGFVLAVLSASGLGCEDPSSDDLSFEDSGFSQVDSSGVLISVTRGDNARAPLGWEVDSVPGLVLGAGDSPQEILYRVQGVRGLPDGGVLVVDGGSRELRFYDSQGRLLNWVGGKGEGPGEFEDPVLVPWVGTDSLLLFDKALPRLQVFLRDGQHFGTFRYLGAWPAGRVPPIGALYPHVLFRKGGFVGGEAAYMQGEGLKQGTREYFWYDPATAERITLDSFVIDVGFRTRAGTLDIPFSSRPAAAVGSKGALITDGRASEVREYDVAGRLRRIFRVEELDRPVTREMIEVRIDAVTAAYPRIQREQLARDYAGVPIPDTLPAFRSLRVDDMGWLWAEVYGWDPAQPREWMVFDPEGRAHGIVETPPGLNIQWIGVDRILGVWLDEFGVEYVRGHSLRRDHDARLVS